MSTRRPAILAAALASLLGACADTSQPKGTCILAVGDSPVQGPDDAWVTVVEFADFQCPYCGMIVPTFEQLETELPADLRLVWKNFPLSFHEHAMPAAKAGWCAHEQGAFWQMHDLLFANQDVAGGLDDSALTSYAADLQLDADAFAACMTSPETTARIEADLALGRTALITGTPTVFVNGKRLVGALPIADFREAIDAARTTAQASGIARADYYASLEASTGCTLTP